MSKCTYSNSDNFKYIYYNTGNILTLNDLKKKAGLNSGDELLEVLKIDAESKDQSERISEHRDVERKDIKITVKIFLSKSDSSILDDALQRVSFILKTDTIDSLVIVINKNENNEDVLPSLQHLWTVVEEFYKNGKLSSIGVSGIDTEKFIQLFNWANVKPNIIQINLATCCVVPPALQEFTKQNDIQLLTHSDPNPIITEESVKEFFGDDAELNWVARYQVHLKCRGVLLSKGYVIRLDQLTRDK